EQLARSRDPAWAYGQLVVRYDFNELASWCSLTTAPASPADVAQLEAAIRVADPEEAYCDPLSKSLGRHSRGVLLPKGVQWYRLHNPMIPDQWIGIAVMQLHFTWRSEQSIWCRVRMGF